MLSLLLPILIAVFPALRRGVCSCCTADHEEQAHGGAVDARLITEMCRERHSECFVMLVRSFARAHAMNFIPSFMRERCWRATRDSGRSLINFLCVVRARNGNDVVVPWFDSFVSTTKNSMGVFSLRTGDVNQGLHDRMTTKVAKHGVWNTSKNSSSTGGSFFT